MFDAIHLKRAEKEREEFIRNCIAFDTPRLENEVFPAECKVESDIAYQPKEDSLKLDIYTPSVCNNDKECFILIHGGAFVYGSKILDKNFGMHLAIKAGIPVVNVDYTLMPESDMAQVMNEIFTAINFICKEYGFEKLHTVGDSAGGYLAYVVAMASRNSDVREGFGVTVEPLAAAESANLICPGIINSRKAFPGIYYEKKTGVKLADFAFDLRELAKLNEDLRISVITGEEDFLRAQDIEFQAVVKDVVFYDAVNEGEYKMFHVFPIAHPEWPQSVKAIGLIADNAVGKK